jgi:hypothetical protein
MAGDEVLEFVRWLRWFRSEWGRGHGSWSGNQGRDPTMKDY